MKRCLLTILFALSLLLFVAVCVLWVRSYSVAYTVMYRHREGKPTHCFFFTSASGRLGIASYWFDHPWRPDPIAWGARRFGLRSRIVEPSDADDMQYLVWERMGVRFFRMGRRGRNTVAYLSIPLYVHVPISTLPLLGAIWLSPVGRRPMSGLCRSCGYDLRATPGRCPECGTVSVQVTEAQKETTK